MSARGRGGRGGGYGGATRGGGPSASHSTPAGGDISPRQGALQPTLTTGRPIQLKVNAFTVDIPHSWIYHYDVAILPDQNVMPIRMNMDIVRRLQEVIAPTVFQPRGSYDGRKNLYATHFIFNEDPDDDTQTYDVTLEDPTPGRRPPKVYTVKITRAKKISTEVLHQFCQGRQPWDNSVQTALQPLNVALRMGHAVNYPSNSRSFFTDTTMRDIGAGIELWRGYFQNVLPSMGKMLVNIDVSTCMVFKRGPLIGTALDFLRNHRIEDLTPGHGLTDLKRRKLQTFLYGCRVLTESAADPDRRIKRTILRISKQGARQLLFDKDGQKISVADYFTQIRGGIALRYPDLPCIELGNGALIPFELCEVIPGQIMRKQLPSDKIAAMNDFAMMKPSKRFENVNDGLLLLNQGRTHYLGQFGMAVQPDPVQFQGLVLNPPAIECGPGSTIPQDTPKSGAWNMIEKELYEPKSISNWIIVSFEDRRFLDRDGVKLIENLTQAMFSVGMDVHDTQPPVFVHSPQSNIVQVLDQDGQALRTKTGSVPALVIVILPNGADDIYAAVKHWGDVMHGIPTQCLQSHTCSRANMQYWANVCLKINVKLGGVNFIPDLLTSGRFSNPDNSTLVMGARITHPAPGADHPSFAAVVGSLDTHAVKYASVLRPQGMRNEIIGELGSMVTQIIQQHIKYGQQVEGKVGTAAHPKRILFYRNGVGRGQIPLIRMQELGCIRRSLEALKINAKITFIMVSKRPHLRYFPNNPNDGDSTGNCPAGTLVDGFTHPTDIDFDLQSHAGVHGTTRPTHYTVIHEGCGFSVNELASITFALCHACARSTRSVSIPAPVHYADLVTARSRNHYDPNQDLEPSPYDRERVDPMVEREALLNTYRANFRPLHSSMSSLMYFS